MSDDQDRVLIPFLGLRSEGNGAIMCMSFASMFSDDEGDEVDDVFMDDIVTLETDIDQVFEDAAMVLDDPDPPKTRPASKTAIEGLEKVKLDKSSVKLCSVCYEDLSVGIEASCLPCSHVYHTACITKWLKQSNTCPFCRYKMPVVDFDLNFTMPDIEFKMDADD